MATDVRGGTVAKDRLSALMSPVWTGLVAERGPGAARAALTTLLNAGALDGWCGHTTHGDRAVGAVAGVDAPAALRRQLASVVVGRRALWPDDRRMLEADALTGDDDPRVEPGCADLDGPRAGWWGVRLLVEAPPVSRSELATRLAALPRASVRAALRHILETAPVPDPVVDLVIAAFEIVGGPGREAAALARLAADEHLPTQLREVAWRVLMDHDGVDLEKVFDEVGASRITELSQLGFAVGVRRLGGSTELSRDLVDQVRALDPTRRRDLLEMIEDARRMEGIPAAALYSPLLVARIAPELDEALVRSLVEDGGRLAEDAIRRTLDEEPDSVAQARLRRALLLMRTRRIEPPVDRGDGARAWVGLCDGRGDFPVVLATPNPRGQHRVVSLSVRAGGEVRDGFVLDDLPTARLKLMLEQYGATAQLFEVRPAEAAAWVAVGVRQTQGGLAGLPGSLQRASDEMLRHLHHRVVHEDGPEGARITLAACRALFRRPRLQGWCLDASDREACDIGEAPRLASAFAIWAREGARKVSQTRRIRQRLAGMTRHLAEVLQTVEDPEAPLALGIARALASGRGETFLRVVLEHTAFHALPPDEPMPLRFGDEGQREDLRRILSPRVPSHLDLATLDVIDCVLSSEPLLVQNEGELADLRPDLRRSVLFEAGRAMVEVLRTSDADLATVEDALARGGLSEASAARAAQRLVRLGQQFRAEVCAECPVACWRTPNRPAGGRWRGPGHPAYR
ncbi:MAG: hypothetical protein AAGA48_04725 [Myxococcota bacterium]